MSTQCPIQELAPQIEYSVAEARARMGAVFDLVSACEDAEKQDRIFATFTMLYMIHGPLAGHLTVELASTGFISKDPEVQKAEAEKIKHEKGNTLLVEPPVVETKVIQAALDSDQDGGGPGGYGGKGGGGPGGHGGHGRGK